MDDVLHFALFGVTFREDQSDSAEYLGGGCLSLYRIIDDVIAEGSAEVI